MNLDEADLFARPLLAKTGLADQPLKSVGVGKKVVARTGRWHRRRRWIGRDRRPEGVGVCVDAVVVVSLVLRLGHWRRSYGGKPRFERFGLDDAFWDLLLEI